LERISSDWAEATTEAERDLVTLLLSDMFINRSIRSRCAGVQHLPIARSRQNSILITILRKIAVSLANR
jgi:hypothetical protein